MKSYKISLIGLFVAITAICSWITIPLPFTPVPINMATFAVIMSGLVLGARLGAISQIIYIFIGIVGMPVFSGFSSGFGVLVGPTGGYLMGYIFIALLSGILSKNHDYKIFIGIVLGNVMCYILGSLWFMYITESNLTTTLTLCVFPFILGDILKILLAYLVFKRIPKRYIISQQI
ncbi:MAG TPA: biotin transporter BioY, partial [Anaerovoracaceae bacterium]|nr:biotin transporter BioY [Anaerovoracaceae bacterium]